MSVRAIHTVGSARPQEPRLPVFEERKHSHDEVRDLLTQRVAKKTGVFQRKGSESYAQGSLGMRKEPVDFVPPVDRFTAHMQIIGNGADLCAERIQAFFYNPRRIDPPLIRHARACAATHDIGDVICSRIVHSFHRFLPCSSELQERVEILFFLLAKIRNKLDTTIFLLLTQAPDYMVGKNISFEDIVQLLQNILQVEELHCLDKSLVESINDFHHGKIRFRDLLKRVMKGKTATSEDAPPREVSIEESHAPWMKFLEKAVREGLLDETDRLQIKQIFLSTCWKRPDCDGKALIDAIVAAKKCLPHDLFNLVIHPVGYQSTSDINLASRLLHQVAIVSALGGHCAQPLLDFSVGRLSARTLDRLLEEMKVAISDQRSPEGVLAEVLGRFSCSAQERERLQTDYEAVLRFGVDLRKKNIDQLVEMAKAIQARARAKPMTKEDSYALIALAREAIRKEFGIYPYNTQVLALLSIINHPDELKGRIAQVRTGEGKSTIIAMLALYEACQGFTVDIISSSRYLAQRDAEKYQKYFAHFGFLTSHLCTDSPERANFAGQIMFGTNFDFEFAIMRDYFSPQPMRVVERERKPLPRPFDVVIVDEVDNMFIDSAMNSARIAIPGNKALSDVYESIFRFVCENEKLLACSFSLGEKLETGVIEEVEELIGKKHFSQLGASRVEILIHSAFTAMLRKENEDYVIKSEKEREDGEGAGIVIVDKKNTGRLEEKSRWDRGVHQFLEVKHGLLVQDEYVMPSSLSHPIFFNKYRNIFGLSGTVGGACERAEITTTYHIDVRDIPPHRPSKRQDLPALVYSDVESYNQALLSEIRQMIATGRPTLILFETIESTLAFSALCTQEGIDFQTLNARQRQEEEHVVAKAGMAGMVTIATNTAGRGTDIVLHPTSLANGGMHVLLTYLPSNLRVEQQGQGRAGRQGQPGSSRIVVLIENPMIRLLSLFGFDISKEIQYSILLDFREKKIAKESEERLFRTAIDKVNDEYLQKFLQKFSSWLASHSRSAHEKTEKVQQRKRQSSPYWKLTA